MIPPAHARWSTSRTRRPATVALLLGLAALPACSSGGSPAGLRGARVEVVGVWQDAEQAAFERVLAGFEAESGATVRYTTTGGRDVGATLDARLAAGDPPDVAVIPQPGLLARYARAGAIVPLDGPTRRQVEGGYGAVWRRLATVDGRLYGVWFKAANKSLVWYSIGAFERAGVVPPTRLASLADVAGALAAAGTPPFAVSAAPADAWTLTDWFENLYLRVAGPDRYDALAERRLAWTDPTVGETLRLLADLLAAAHVAGGPDGALAATFPESVAAVFSPTPAAAMVVGGDFVAGVARGSVAATVGTDVDVFPFPEPRPERRYVVGGGDAAVLMRDSPPGRALVRYLATPEAAETWAALGGFVSANEDVDLAAYPDAVSRRAARALLEAGDGLRFDLSDLQPVGFGGTTGQGMGAILRDFLAGPGDAAATADRLEQAAAAAWGR